jgi:isopentenyl-diphosphate Delta-isomerase
MERVVLVDENDAPLGTMEKMEAHEKGVLHRAFSVFIFNSIGEMLLQQRAFSKYHSGGLWTNACCSHPREGEATIDAAHRRLQEEMGFDCEIKKAFDFIYKKELDQGLTEHEFDHVFIGEFEEGFHFNPDEVSAAVYKPVQEVLEEVAQTPEKYTEWFKICLSEVIKRVL